MSDAEDQNCIFKSEVTAHRTLGYRLHRGLQDPRIYRLQGVTGP